MNHILSHLEHERSIAVARRAGAKQNLALADEKADPELAAHCFVRLGIHNAILHYIDPTIDALRRSEGEHGTI